MPPLPILPIPPPPPRFWSLAHSSSFSTPRKKRERKGGGEKFPSRCFHNNRLRQRSLARRSSSNLDPGQIITSFGKPTANEKRKGEKAHLLLSLSSPKRIGCRLSSLFSLVVPLHPTPSPSPLLSSISIPFYELRSFVRSLGCPSICSLVHFQNASSHFLCLLPFPLLFRSHCV